MSQQLLTITKNLVKEDQVVAVMPRVEYESFLRFTEKKKSKNIAPQITVKRSKSFKVNEKYEDFYNQLDKDLTSTLREYEKTGESCGPFDDVDDLMKSLRS